MQQFNFQNVFINIVLVRTRQKIWKHTERDQYELTEKTQTFPRQKTLGSSEVEDDKIFWQIS